MLAAHGELEMSLNNLMTVTSTTRIGWLEGQLLCWMMGLDVGSGKGWDDAGGWSDGVDEGFNEGSLDGCKES